MEGTIAEIRLFASNFAPRNWAFCDGQLLAINSNTALFSLLGTIYGGDGRTTFGLPDFRGRVAIGEGHGPGLSNYTLGEKGGNEQTVLQLANMPAHNHSPRLYSELAVATISNPTDRLLAGPPAEAPIYADSDPSAEVAMHVDSIKSNTVGNNSAFSNVSPFLGMHYIICLQGIFPSRS
ncbi:phage tail protein [Gymnodinialimonas sp.]